MKILITGYIGFHNLGDEAILEGTLSLLREAGLGADITAASGDPAGTERAHAVRAVPLSDLRALDSAIAESDLVLWGGGSLIHDYWGFEPRELYDATGHAPAVFLRVPLLSAAHGVPCIAWAQGFSQLKLHSTERALAEALRACRAVFVRDAESRAEVGRVGFGGPIVQMPDAALALPTRQAAPAVARRLIGVCIRPWALSGGDWPTRLRAVLNEVGCEREVAFQLVALQHERDFAATDDLATARELAEGLANAGASAIVCHPTSPGEAIAQLAECDVVLAMRYHGAVFAALGGVPVVPLIYDAKVRALASEIASEGAYADLDSFRPADLAGLIYRTLDQSYAERERISAFVARSKRRLSEIQRLLARLPEWIDDPASVAGAAPLLPQSEARIATSDTPSTDHDRPAADAVLVPDFPTSSVLRLLFNPEPDDEASQYDIVCFSIINWEFRWQRPQQMMSEWAKRGRRVFYLRISDFLPEGGHPIEVTPLRDGIWEVRMALPAGFNVYSQTAPEDFETKGLLALRHLREEFGITAALSVVEIASWTPIALRARSELGWLLAYDCMDDWRHFPRIAEEPGLLARERQLVSSADLVILSSPVIAEHWSALRSDLVVARNAADYEFFHAATGEDPLPEISGPVAGYFGALAPWVDVDLLVHAARARPDVTFVLLGGVFDIDVEELRQLSNVRLLGQQPYEMMPRFLRRFDVCLIPFRVSDLTDGVDPVKFYEYVSQGKPVVSTPIRSIVPYEEHLYLAHDPSEFVDQLDRALAENDPARRERRVEVARENTWEHRIDDIEKAIGRRAVSVYQLWLREHEASLKDQELEMLRSELTSERQRGDKALQEVVRLQQEHVRFQKSRLWRTANFYWRGRRLLGRLARRSPIAALRRTDHRPPTLFRAAPARDSAFDVVCFPIINWDFRFQRPQQLMSRLGSAGHRVFYISTQFRLGGPPYEVNPRGENVYEVSLRGPVLDVYREVPSDAAVDQFFESLGALRRDLGLAGTVSVTQLPFWWPLAQRAQERWAWPVVYDLMDHHAGFHEDYPSELVALEESMVGAAHLVLASSHTLTTEASERSRNVMLLPNACDYEHFAAVRAVPPRPRPVVGYYGAIASWFDADLVADLAEQRPDWDFLLVGSTSQGDTSRLSRLPNVALAGEQPYSSLPQWLERMDVLTIPFRLTSLTDATNPVKMYEILAAGKPLVSVPLKEVEPMAPAVRLASGAAEFEREIVAVLEEQAGRARELAFERRALAKAETWDARIAALEPRLAGAFPRASIVIVTYNNLEMNRGCLESLFGRTAWPGLEVHIVDNASTDGTAQWLKEAASTYPGLNVILNSENRGFAAANNQGLAQATGDFLILLNNDTVVPRGWLSPLIRHLHADRTIGLIGPVTNAVGNEAKVEVGYKDVAGMPEWAARYVREHDGETFDIPMLAMFCVGMRRDVFERIGTLDERFNVGMFEDDDYTRRMRNAGLRIVCARDAFVHHWWRAAFGKIEDERYRQIFERNKQLYEEKWGIRWEPHRGPEEP